MHLIMLGRLHVSWLGISFIKLEMDKAINVCEGLLVGLHVLSSKTYKPDETRHIQYFIQVVVPARHVCSFQKIRPGVSIVYGYGRVCLGFAGFRLLVLLVAYRIEVSRSSTWRLMQNYIVFNM